MRPTPIAFVLTLLLCTACGGGGGAPDDDATPPDGPQATVLYPTAASVTTASVIVVRGTTTHDQAIASVEVNGNPATSTDGFATWEARVDLPAGENAVTVSVVDAEGTANATAAALMVYREPQLAAIRAMAPDPSLDAVYTLGVGANLVTQVRLDTGRPQLVSGLCRGQGPVVEQPTGIAKDVGSNTLLVLDAGTQTLVAVHAADGNRRILSGAGFGPGLVGFEDVTALGYLSGWVEAPDTAFVADAGHLGVLAVDITTGARRMLSDATHGAGPLFQSLTAVAIDTSYRRLLVMDRDAGAVLTVDLTSGDRSVLSDADVGGGRPIEVPGSLVVDEDRARALYIEHSAPPAIMAVDLATGARTEIPAATTGLTAPALLSMAPGGNATLVLDLQRFAIVELDLTTGIATDRVRWRRGDGPDWTSLDAIVYGPGTDRVFALARFDGQDVVAAVDVDTGDRSVVSGASRGVGPLFVEPRDVLFDDQDGALYVLDGGLEQILRVDAATGDRTVVSTPAVAPALIEAETLALDRPRGRLLLIDTAASTLVAVDLATGIPTVVSGAGVAGGVPFVDPRTLTVHEEAGVAYVGDVSQGTVYTVDLATGDRGILTSPDVGSGSPLPTGGRLYQLEMDVEAGQVLVLGDGPKDLFAIDVAGGHRHLLMTPVLGTGSLLVRPDDLSLDPERRVLYVKDRGQYAIAAVDLGAPSPIGDRFAVSAPALGVGPDLGEPTDVALNGGAFNAYVLDASRPAVFEVRVDTGNRRLISGDGEGSGVAFDRPVALAYDEPRNRILVLDRDLDALLAVDRESGARTVISDASTGFGPAFSIPAGLALPLRSDTAYVVDAALDALIEVDVLTGNRRIVSDDTTGFGVLLGSPEGVVIDTRPGMNRALVVDPILDALVGIDLDTGTRTVLSDDRAFGPDLGSPRRVVLDAEGCRVLVVDDGLGALLEIDLARGDRRIVADDTLGFGRAFEGSELGLAFDARRRQAYVVDSDRPALLRVDVGSIQRVLVSRSAFPSEDN